MRLGTASDEVSPRHEAYLGRNARRIETNSYGNLTCMVHPMET